MRKKIILSIVCCLFILGFTTGCGNKSVDNKEIINYLNNKYNQEFKYIEDGNDVWSSEAKTKIYSDANGNKFNVKISNDYLTDTYYSIVYDNEITKKYQKQFDSSYKIFVSSESYYTNANDNYLSVDDYIEEIPTLNIVIYTTNNIQITKTKLNEITFDNTFINGVIYSVSNDEFISINNYNYNLANIINSKSFNVTNGTLDYN